MSENESNDSLCKKVAHCAIKHSTDGTDAVVELPLKTSPNHLSFMKSLASPYEQSLLSKPTYAHSIDAAYLHCWPKLA